MANQTRNNARTQRDNYQDVHNRYEGGINGGRAIVAVNPGEAVEVEPVVITGKRRSRRRVQHPGFVESMVPFWGSGKEAIADYQEGDYFGAVANGLLAATDLVPGAYLVKTLGKSSFRIVKFAKPHTSKALRAWMIKNGYERASKLKVERHHWAVPDNGWGKNVPGWIRNQPLNLHEMNPATHQRIHRNWKGQDRFGPIKRTYLGTPIWARVSAGSLAGKGAEGVRDYYDHSEDE